MSAQPASHLRLVRVDDETGEVQPVDSDALQSLERELDKLRNDIANAERDLRAKRRRIAELERDKARERLDHPDREFIVRVCRYWAKKCRPGATRLDPLSPDRFDAVAALAEMQLIEMVEVDGKKRRQRVWRYPAEAFKAAVDGAAFDPFETTHKNGKVERHNDLSQVCKDVTRFERFISKAPYEPVPLAGFTRLGPGELAHARERAHNAVSSSKVAADSAARSIGGQHGWDLGSQDRRPAGTAAGRWPEGRTVLQRLLRGGIEGLPASWT